MDTLKNIGLIECSLSNDPYGLDLTSRLNGFHLKKVLVKRNISDRLAKLHYPQAEIVENKKDILNDTTIELVLVAAPEDEDLSLITEALEAGKQVRII